MLLSHQKVPKVATTCSYSKEEKFLLIKGFTIKVTLKSLLLLVSMKKLSKPDEWLQNKWCSFIAELLTFSLCFQWEQKLQRFTYPDFKMALSFAMIDKEAVVLRCSVKKVLLEILQNSQENTRARDSFLIKLQLNFIEKESLAQVFSCEFCEISKNTFFYRTSLVAASVDSIAATSLKFINNVRTYKNRNFIFECEQIKIRIK